MEEQLLGQAIQEEVPWEKLSKRLKSFLGSAEVWQRRVKEYCIKKRYRWSDCAARQVSRETDYYEELMRYLRKNQGLFPYHLADHVCRVLRISPFRYYCDMMHEVMKQERSYDTIPNFSAADALRETGIGRNQYIDIMNRTRAKLMWKFSKGGLKELLPAHPVEFPLEPWWHVAVVNLTNEEYRKLSEEEVTVLERSGRDSAGLVGEFDVSILRDLYKKGLIYFDVPVNPFDRFRVATLEGFISNRNQQYEDFTEELLYAVFVASSEQTTVKDLAATLQADLRQLEAAISLAARLGWAEKVMDVAALFELDNNLPISSGGLGGAGGSSALELGGEGGGEEDGQVADADALRLRKGEPTRIAFLVDANLTSFLMMGSFSHALKQHAVTLFEAGKLPDRAVADLCAELKSVEGSQLEGELQHFADHAFSLRYVLQSLQGWVPPPLSSSSSAAAAALGEGGAAMALADESTPAPALGEMPGWGRSSSVGSWGFRGSSGAKSWAGGSGGERGAAAAAATAGGAAPAARRDRDADLFSPPNENTRMSFEELLRQAEDDESGTAGASAGRRGEQRWRGPRSFPARTQSEGGGAGGGGAGGTRDSLGGGSSGGGRGGGRERWGEATDDWGSFQGASAPGPSLLGNGGGSSSSDAFDFPRQSSVNDTDSDSRPAFSRESSINEATPPMVHTEESADEFSAWQSAAAGSLSGRPPPARSLQEEPEGSSGGTPGGVASPSYGDTWKEIQQASPLGPDTPPTRAHEKESAGAAAVRGGAAAPRRAGQSMRTNQVGSNTGMGPNVRRSSMDADPLLSPPPEGGRGLPRILEREQDERGKGAEGGDGSRGGGGGGGGIGGGREIEGAGALLQQQEEGEPKAAADDGDGTLGGNPSSVAKRSGGKGGGGKPRAVRNRIEIMRCESLAGLPPVTLQRILRRDFNVVVSMTPLASPLTIDSSQGVGPVHLGPPSPAAITPWMKLLLYSTCCAGPTSVALVRGQRIRRLPPPLAGCRRALIWSWDGTAVGGVGGKAEGSLVEGALLLHVLNSLLEHTALFVQPFADGSASLDPKMKAVVTHNIALPVCGPDVSGTSLPPEEAADVASAGTGSLSAAAGGAPAIKSSPPHSLGRGEGSPKSAKESFSGNLPRLVVPPAGDVVGPPASLHASSSTADLGTSEDASGAYGHGGEPGVAVAVETPVGAEGGSMNGTEDLSGRDPADETGIGGAGVAASVASAAAAVQAPVETGNEDDTPRAGVSKTPPPPSPPSLPSRDDDSGANKWRKHATVQLAIEELGLNTVGTLRMLRVSRPAEGGPEGPGGALAPPGEPSGGATQKKGGPLVAGKGEGQAGGVLSSENEEYEWVPHNVEFGVPLYDTELCRQVCEGAVRGSMFEPAPLEEQRKAMLALSQRLRDFIADYCADGAVARAMFSGNAGLLRHLSSRWQSLDLAEAVDVVTPSPHMPAEGARWPGPDSFGDAAPSFPPTPSRLTRRLSRAESMDLSLMRRGRVEAIHKMEMKHRESTLKVPAPVLGRGQEPPPPQQASANDELVSSEVVLPGINLLFDGTVLHPLDIGAYLQGRLPALLVAEAKARSDAMYPDPMPKF